MYLKLFLVVLIFQDISADLPPHIKVCSKNSPDREECLKSAIESLAPYLKSGNFAPDVKLNPTVDPIPFGDFNIGNGFKLVLKNFKMINTTPFKIEKISINSGKNVKMNVLINVPKPKGYSDYELEWKLGPIDIKGKGKEQLLFENLKIYVQLTGVRESRNGIEYIKISNTKAKIQINGIKMRFENLFNGNKQLEDAASELINQNSDILLKESVPKFEKVLSALSLRMSNQIFSKIPADILFP